MKVGINRALALPLVAALPIALACANSSSARNPRPVDGASSKTDAASELNPEPPDTPQAEEAPATAELGSFGLDLSTQNPDIQPGDDFYEFANGAWLTSYQLQPDEVSHGTSRELRDRSEERVKAIIDEVSRGNPKPGSVEQQIGDFFASFMAVDALNEKGITPLQDDLQAIDRIANRGELVEAFGRNWHTATGGPIGFGVRPDRKNPDRQILNVWHTGLGLPDRDYYLEDTERFRTIREAYEQNIATVLGFTGLSAPEAKTAATQVLALETAIAQEHWPRTELRNRDKTYNPMKLAELPKRYPGYPWQRHLRAAKIDTEGLEDINVGTPSAIQPLAELVRNTPLTT